MAKKVNVFIGAKNKMAAGLRSSLKSLKKFNRKAKASLRSLGQTFRRVGIIAGTAFVGLVKFGNQFRTQMAQVNTMLGDGSTLIPKVTKQVRDLSAEFGVAKKTLTEGLYQALSAGVPADNVMEFMRVATEAAVGGVTDVKTSVDGLTTVLNAYGIAADKARDVSDILFTVVKDGKINYEELAENIGKVAPTAKIAGVGLRDLAAMTATLVKIEKPERAFTALRQSMFFAAQEGKTLKQVLTEFEGKNLEDLLKAGVNKKEAAGIALMAGNMKLLRKEMESFKDTAGAADEAFKKVDAMRHWQKIWQSILSVTSRVGEMLDKTLAPAISRLSEMIRNFGKSGKFDQFIDKVRRTTEDVNNLIKALTSGKDRRDAVMKAFAGIIREAFARGAQTAIKLLWKAMPLLGMALGLAAKAALSGTSEREFEQAEARLVKRGEIKKTFGRREMFGMAFGNAGPSGEREKIKSEIIAQRLRDVEKRVGKVKFGGGSELQAALAVFEQAIKPRATDNMPTDIFRPTVRRKTGNLTGVAGGVAGAGGGAIGGETSMLGIGALFTMMQTGGAAKATLLSETQKQTAIQAETLVQIKQLNGGVK